MIYAVENHEPEDGILRLSPHPAATTPQEAAVLVAESSALNLTRYTASVVLVAEQKGEGLELTFWRVHLDPTWSALPLQPALAMGGAL